MDIGSILVILALTIITVVFIGRPLFERRGVAVTREDRKLSALQAERDRILAAIEELEMDFAMGKISEQPFRTRRAALVGEGARVLRSIDSVVGERDQEREASDLDAEIEAAVARLRGERADAGQRTCPSCGGGVQPEDRFCVRCGAPVTNVEASG
jgi:hypothetical protein